MVGRWPEKTLEEVTAMSRQGIYITKSNLKELRALIEGVQRSGLKEQSNLNKLEKELDRAKVVAPGRLSPDVVTMNSQVRVLDIASNNEAVYTIVFPGQARIEDRKISILAPLGTALLGYRVGDVVEWEVPSGVKHFKIQEVLHQPEAAGAGAETVGGGR
jgi:regulator of nucleoside diphosphate kinase